MSAQCSETALYERACDSFRSKNFTACEEALRDLLLFNPAHPKLLANKALLEFTQQKDLKSSTIYLAELRRIASEEKIDLCPEHNNCSSTNVAGAVPAVKQICPQSSLSLTLRYNYALVLFYQRQYQKAERIISACLGVPSLDFCEGVLDVNIFNRSFPRQPLTLSAMNLVPLPDLVLGHRLVLLWLDTLLHLQHPERVYELCSYWLTLLSSATVVDNLNASHSPIPKQNTTEVGTRFIVNQTTAALQGLRVPLQLFYLRSCLLTGRLHAAELELKQLDLDESNTAERQQSASVESSTFASIDQFKLACNFMRGHMAYLEGKHSEALQILAKIPDPTPDVLTEVRCSLPHLIFNNCALIHHKEGKYNLSCLQLKRAAAELDRLLQRCVHQIRSSQTTNTTDENVEAKRATLNQLSLYLLPWTECHATVYNTAISLLFAQKSSAAFPVLLKLISVYPRNPLLWLRIAECCIKINQPSNLQAWQLPEKSRCAVQVVGSGPCRTLMFANREQSSPSSYDASATSSSPKPTMDFAYSCLRNALLLLPRVPDEITDKDSLIEWSDTQSVPCLPSASPLRGFQLLHVLSFAHLSIAYVALCLDNPVDTLHRSSMLLPALPDTGKVTQNNQSAADENNLKPLPTSLLSLVAPPSFVLLARLYLAEALTCFDRVNEAISLLQSMVPTSHKGDPLLRHLASTFACEMPFSMESVENKYGDDKSRPGASSVYTPEFPSTGLQASSLLLFNLAVALAFDKRWSLAEEYLQTALPGLSLPIKDLDGRKHPSSFDDILTCLPLQAIVLRVYLLMAMGKPDRAMLSLRQHFGDSALAGRLNPPSVPAHLTEGFGLDKGPTSTGGSIRHNLKRLFDSWKPPNQRSSNLLASVTQQTFRHPLTPQPAPGFPPIFPGASALTRWTHTPFAVRQPYTTGLITPANEHDWPPL